MQLALYSVIIIDNERESVNLIKKYIDKLFLNKLFVVDVFSTLDGSINKIRKILPKIIIVNSDLGESELIKFLEIKDQDSLNFQFIIISENEEFAIRALKYQAVDFVLKPIDEFGIANALRKAVYEVKKERIEAGIREMNKTKTNFKFISITTASDSLSNTTLFVRADKVTYCEALGGQTIFHTIDGEEFISDKSLGKYEWILENKFFFRIHNRYLVNLNLVNKIERVGGASSVLFNKIAIPISTRKYPLLYKYLNLKR